MRLSLLPMLPLILGGCATATTPREPAPAPLIPEPAPTRVEPAPLAGAEPPFIFAPWDGHIVVSAEIRPEHLVNPTIADDGYEAVRQIPDLAMPPELRALIGQDLRVTTVSGESDCKVRVLGFDVVSSIDPEIDDTTSLYPEPDANGDVADHLPPEVYAARLWDLGRKVIAIRRDGLIPAECDGPLFALAPGAEPQPRLSKRAATPEESKAALAIVRAHALWDLQQEAYTASLALAKRHAARLRKAGYSLALAKKPPAKWDSPRPESDYTQPMVEVWTDPDGSPRYHQVVLGNDVACDAPRLWFFVDPVRGEVVRYDLEAWPLVALDLDRDGAWDMMREEWGHRWVEPIEPGPSDAPEALRSSFGPAGDGTHCGWEQVPPRAVIERVAAGKGAQAEAGD